MQVIYIHYGKPLISRSFSLLQVNVIIRLHCNTMFLPKSFSLAVHYLDISSHLIRQRYAKVIISIQTFKVECYTKTLFVGSSTCHYWNTISGFTLVYDLSLSPLRWSWTITGIAPSPSVICLAFANKGRIVLQKKKYKNPNYTKTIDCVRYKMFFFYIRREIGVLWSTAIILKIIIRRVEVLRVHQLPCWFILI